MLLIPFNYLVLYPAPRRFGYELTALRRMTAGIAFAGLSWFVVVAMQLVIDHGNAFSITWQILSYALLTFGRSAGRHHPTRIRRQPDVGSILGWRQTETG
ncbi:MAG TPA: hypothetical protein VK581_13510 [Chthoniobacterales bacterium]|nr:hypothetical protein [Chthoniobacterales bacterium]